MFVTIMLSSWALVFVYTWQNLFKLKNNFLVKTYLNNVRVNDVDEYTCTYIHTDVHTYVRTYLGIRAF